MGPASRRPSGKKAGGTPAPPPTLPPAAYHLAEPANWPSILRRGLLPADELLRQSGLSAAKQKAWHAAHRPALTTLADGTLIRDQDPMPPAALARCLVGVSPAQWYRHLNSRVFFWLDRGRMERMRATYRARPLLLLTLDTAKLLAEAGDHAEVTPINTGFALRKAAKRGPATFVPLAEWRANGWAGESAALATAPRPRSHAPVELVVRGGLPGAMSCVRTVAEWPAGAAGPNPASTV